MYEDQIDPIGATRLYAVARALSAARSGAEVAAALFDHALADVGVESVGLWMREGSAVRFVGGAGMAPDLPPEVTLIPIEADMPAPAAVRSGQPVTYRSRDERDREWPLLRGVETKSEAVAVLPLVSASRILGALHVGWTALDDGRGFDLPFLVRLAELGASAIDRAALHDAERERQAFLLDASAAVSGAGGLAETLHRLAAVAVPRLADLCLIDVRQPDRSIRRMAAVHSDPAVSGPVAELAARVPTVDHPAFAAMAGRRAIWAADMPEEFLRRIFPDPRHYELARALAFTSYVCVPLLSGADVLGAITLVSAGSGRRFGPTDAALADELAWRVAGVVAAAHRHDRDLQLAHELQTLLLPDRLPEVDGAEIAARYLTAQSEAEAGGDFYDVVRLPSGRIGFVIGDVEGHDAAAAATMGQLRSALRALSGQIREPAPVIDALRWSWDLLGFSRMATCIVGRLDPADGTIVMASAGHLPPILLDAERDPEFIDLEVSPPLGAPAGPARQWSGRLEPGQTVFLYTDGLVERRVEAIDRSLARLRTALVGAGGDPVDSLCSTAVAGQVDPGRLADDVAILALRRVAARSNGAGQAGTASGLS